MTLYFAQGSPTTVLTDQQVREALFACFEQLGKRRRVVALPPDFTRFNSMRRAADLPDLRVLRRAVDGRDARVGNARPDAGLAIGEDVSRFADVADPPASLARTTWSPIGHVPAAYVSEVTEGIWTTSRGRRS
jgi:hypothetical protein